VALSGHKSAVFLTGKKEKMVFLQNPFMPRGVAAGRISLQKGESMTWTSPVFEEVVLCCEINSYVSAKL